MLKKIILFVVWLFLIWNVFANWTYDDATYLAKKSLIVVDKSKVDKLYQAWSKTWAVNLLFMTSGLNNFSFNLC